MTVEQQEIARVHVLINTASDEYRERLHTAVQSWADVHALNTHLQALAEDQREAIRLYASTLTAIRAALGAVEDADLVECVRALVAENDGRRRTLEWCSEERQVEWTRAERAEAGRDRVLTAIRNYKAAVDGLNGVADAEAAMFAVLAELEGARRHD